MPGEHASRSEVRPNHGKSGFVWPPRGAAKPEPAPARREAGEVGVEVQRDARPSVDLHPLTPVRIRRPWHPALHAAILQIETVWLGQTRAPFADRAAAEGWQPDSAARFCPRCGVSTGEHEALDPDELGEGVPLADAGCPECRGRRLKWDRLVRLGEYRGVLREAVQEVKFSRWRRLGNDVGRLLGEQLVPFLNRAGVDRGRLALVPVPIPFWRRVVRGIDHTLVIARGVREVTGGRISSLISRREGVSQLSVSGARRRDNVVGTMRARRGLRTQAWEGWTFIVIDDVKTTGATMNEACKTLRRGLGDAGKGAPVWGAVAAVAGERPGRRAAQSSPAVGGE